MPGGRRRSQLSLRRFVPAVALIVAGRAGIQSLTGEHLAAYVGA